MNKMNYLILLVFILVFTSVSHAAVVNINFSGEFSAIDPNDDPLLLQGTQFSVVLQYDETAIVPATLSQDMTTTDGALFIQNSGLLEESRIIETDFSLTNLPNNNQFLVRHSPSFAFQDKITSQPSTIPEMFVISSGLISNGQLFQGLASYLLVFDLEENSNVNFSPEDASVGDMVMSTLPLNIIPREATINFSSFIDEIEPNFFVFRDAGTVYEIVNDQLTAQYVPLPAAFWLFGSSLIGFFVWTRSNMRKKF